MSDNPYSIRNPKVDPGKRPVMRPDNTPDDNNRIEIGPTPMAYEEWAMAGLQCPDLPAMRQYRLDRIVAGLIERNLDAVLLFDPLSIRYATDTTHMQLWNAHNPFRACMVTADGYMILWEYGGHAYMSEYYLSIGNLPLALGQLQMALELPDINGVERSRYRARIEQIIEYIPEEERERMPLP